MSDDTNGNPRNTSSTEKKNDVSGPPDAPKIRDFVYLNQDRVFSYLSQIEGGLKLLYSKLENESWEERKGKPTKTTNAGAELTGSAAMKLLALAEANVEGKLSAGVSVETGVDERVERGSEGSVDLFGLHHKAFDLVVDRLGSRLVTVRGSLLIADINWLERKIKDFPEIIKASNAFVADKKDHATPPSNTTQMSYLFRAYLANRILAIIRAECGQVNTAYLDPKHLIYPVDNIISDYGQTPTLKFTMVGIAAPPQRASDAGDFSVAHFHPDAQSMAELFANFAGSMQNMRDFFEIKSREGHIVPLALYTEI